MRALRRLALSCVSAAYLLPNAPASQTPTTAAMGEDLVADPISFSAHLTATSGVAHLVVDATRMKRGYWLPGRCTLRFYDASNQALGDASYVLPDSIQSGERYVLPVRVGYAAATSVAAVRLSYRRSCIGCRAAPPQPGSNNVDHQEPTIELDKPTVDVSVPSPATWMEFEVVEPALGLNGIVTITPHSGFDIWDVSIRGPSPDWGTRLVTVGRSHLHGASGYVIKQLTDAETGPGTLPSVRTESQLFIPDLGTSLRTPDTRAVYYRSPGGSWRVLGRIVRPRWWVN
jgi:hypothetical protein